MTFLDVVRHCIGVPGFVKEYDRLMGRSLGKLATRSPLEEAIDKATGKEADEFTAFAAFVHETVWSRLPFAQKTA